MSRAAAALLAASLIPGAGCEQPVSTTTSTTVRVQPDSVALRVGILRFDLPGVAGSGRGAATPRIDEPPRLIVGIAEGEGAEIGLAVLAAPSPPVAEHTRELRAGQANERKTFVGIGRVEIPISHATAGADRVLQVELAPFLRDAGGVHTWEGAPLFVIVIADDVALPAVDVTLEVTFTCSDCEGTEIVGAAWDLGP
jgi:hypothetical protein